uniref:Uncharacterized protein n=1 Tax=Mus spicilegus TaxID=10103 RepID=A0A8C6I5U8_MUSSI
MDNLSPEEIQLWAHQVTDESMESTSRILGLAIESQDEFFPCAHIFKAFPHFLFYKFQCLWFYVKFLDPLRFDLSTRR